MNAITALLAMVAVLHRESKHTGSKKRRISKAERARRNKRTKQQGISRRINRSR